MDQKLEAKFQDLHAQPAYVDKNYLGTIVLNALLLIVTALAWTNASLRKKIDDKEGQVSQRSKDAVNLGYITSGIYLAHLLCLAKRIRVKRKFIAGAERTIFEAIYTYHENIRFFYKDPVIIETPATMLHIQPVAVKILEYDDCGANDAAAPHLCKFFTSYANGSRLYVADIPMPYFHELSDGKSNQQYGFKEMTRRAKISYPEYNDFDAASALVVALGMKMVEYAKSAGAEEIEIGRLVERNNKPDIFKTTEMIKLAELEQMLEQFDLPRQKQPSPIASRLR